MITIDNKRDCSGCSACSQVCVKQSIIMCADEEGFVYPKVNLDTCTNCGLCAKVCPLTGKVAESANPIKVLACKNKDAKTRNTSSSGGTFFLLAKTVLDKGGIVCGCAWNDDCVARHIFVTTETELRKLQSSKYVQSELQDTFKQVKQHLLSDKTVLFSGTPCQVAGLKNFLRKSYKNLITIDLLCHGVPSPKLFEDYKQMMGKRYGGKVTWANCRNKDKSWKRLSMELTFDNGKRYCKLSNYDPYLAVFLSNKSLRPSCYDCMFTKNDRVGDITLGDFWGLGRQHYEFDDDRGISMVLLNTDRGVALYEGIQAHVTSMEKDLQTAISGNKVLCESTKRHPDRAAFFKTYLNDGFEAAIKQFAHIPSPLVQTWTNFMRWGLDIKRRLLKQGW